MATSTMKKGGNKDVVSLDVIMNKLCKIEKGQKELESEIKSLKMENKEAKLREKEKEVLDHIKESPKKKTIGEIAEEMNRSKSTMSNYLKGLYDAGCISRMEEVVETGPKRKARILKYFLKEEE